MSRLLPDHLTHGLSIVFCGTEAERTSAARGQRPAHKGNRFWGVLAEAGLTLHVLRPEDGHLLPGYGIGLTDLATTVAGMDKHIPEVAYVPERLTELVAVGLPKAIAFTSLEAARTALADHSVAAGPLGEDARWPGVALWVLSSPSGANAHFNAASWCALGAWRRSLP